MSLTRRHTALLGVFFIGLIALAADRTILRPQGGPGAASAASDSEEAAMLSNNVPILQDRLREPGVAERLADLWSQKEPDFEQMRNPFALPASWFETPGAVEERIPDGIASFIQTHQLTAVVVNSDACYVLVNDRFLIPGQILDGFTLISVGERSAVFESEGKQAILSIANQ